jgi:hypothetical protein
MLKFSTHLGNTMVNALCNGGSGVSHFNDAIIDYYSAPQPSSADAAVSGTLLASMTLPSDAMTAASGRACAMQGNWQTDSGGAVGAGTVAWARIRRPGDSGGTSLTADRIDAVVTARGGGGDLTLGSLVLAVGQPVAVAAFTVGVPG